jgi:acyl-CoA hydrolase
MQIYETNHLVTQSDLNHHNSLLAPVQAAWHMIAGFNCAAMAQGTTLGIVARNIDQLSYTAPGRGGQIMLMKSRVVRVTDFTITVHTSMAPFGGGKRVSESYITYTTIEEGTSTKRAHGVVLDEPADEEEAKERATAALLIEGQPDARAVAERTSAK